MLGQQNERPFGVYELAVIVLATVGIIVFSYFLGPRTQTPRVAEPEIPPVSDLANTAELPLEPATAAPAVEDLPEPRAVVPEGPAVPAPPPAEPAALEETITLANDRLRLEFTRVGARLKQACVLIGDSEDQHPRLVPESPEILGDPPLYPLGLHGLKLGDNWRGDELDYALWEATVDETGRSVTFTYEQPGVARVTKLFSLDSDEGLLDVSVVYANLSDAAQRLGLDTHVPAFTLNWTPALASDENGQAGPVQKEVIWRKSGQNEHHATSGLEPPDSDTGYSTERVVQPDWMAVKSVYFLMAMRVVALPDAPWLPDTWGWVAGSPERYRFGIATPRMEVAPGASETRDFRIYLGPTHLASLKEAASRGFPELDEGLQFFTMFGFMDWFAKLLLSLLNFFHNTLHASYGIAIVLLTVVVRLFMFPLTIKSMKSMKKVQLLAPEMEKIKAEFKDNPQEMQKRTMDLYRQYGVNPLGGCFPMLLQMPVFIALYRMLWSAFELRGTSFLWIQDLSRQDALIRFPWEIPLVFTSIDAINVLPILMAVAMYVSQKLMPTSGPVQTQQQKMMLNFMPVLFSVFCYNVAAGLNLYILTSTLLGIGQSYLTRMFTVELTPQELKKKPAARKPQHFYDAAQARKRQAAKEMRRAKKQPKGRGDAVTKRDPRKRS
ncbi:MAG: membrane protein insertase YidC [Candidatus Hydrogenedentes bacterium]|nr:membrane protein insertase YidC [Candidatus Hydrogenedentota bacterium]